MRERVKESVNWPFSTSLLLAASRRDKEMAKERQKSRNTEDVFDMLAQAAH